MKPVIIVVVSVTATLGALAALNRIAMTRKLLGS